MEIATIALASIGSVAVIMIVMSGIYDAVERLKERNKLTKLERRLKKESKKLKVAEHRVGRLKKDIKESSDE